MKSPRLRNAIFLAASLSLAVACGDAASNGNGDSSSGSGSAGDNGGSASGDNGGNGNGTGDDASTDGGSAGNGGSATSGNNGTSDSGNAGNNGGNNNGGNTGGTTGVSIIVEPNGNGGAELVAAIKAAKTSVHMTMYILSSSEVVNALIDRRNAGLDVKVILNQNFPSGGGNSSQYTTLNGNGVQVVWAPSAFTYTHEKCVIIDGKTAWIMTMNATYSSPTDNREYLAIDNDANDVAEAEQVFAADFGNHSVQPNGSLLVAPVNARQDLVALIGSATSKIDVEGEEFSDTAVANALVSASNSGIKVRLVVANSSPTSSQTNAINAVKAAGVKVVKSGGTSGSSTSSNPYIHAKALVVDGVRGYVGSENFSGGSLGYNRELGVIVGNQAEIAKVQTAIDTDFSKGSAL